MKILPNHSQAAKFLDKTMIDIRCFIGNLTNKPNQKTGKIRRKSEKQ